MFGIDEEYKNRFSKGSMKINFNERVLKPGQQLTGTINMQISEPLAPGFQLYGRIYAKETVGAVKVDFKQFNPNAIKDMMTSSIVLGKPRLTGRASATA